MISKSKDRWLAALWISLGLTWLITTILCSIYSKPADYSESSDTPVGITTNGNVGIRIAPGIGIDTVTGTIAPMP